MLSREGQREQEAARAVMILRRAEGVEAMRTPRAVATSVLKAADEADRTNGIARVDVRDEATIERVARKLADINGEGWVFDPPILDGITREAMAPEVYWRQARAVLAALEES